MARAGIVPVMPTPSLPRTIDEVVARLDDVIDGSRRTKSRLGYFAALYRKVTVEVKKGIADGVFEDGERMERLDVAFANRYLEALDQYEGGGSPTASWQVAFTAAKRPWPIVLQHLLLGMNAHINLDLGIAAARVSPGAQIWKLETDFNRINGILAELSDDTQRELSQIWPALKLIGKAAGKADDVIVNFSISRARAFAWQVAVDLAPLSSADQQARIDELDREVSAIGRVIRKPGPVARFFTMIIRLTERGGVPKIIDILR
jgi:hypothetical protein